MTRLNRTQAIPHRQIAWSDRRTPSLHPASASAIVRTKKANPRRDSLRTQPH